jgi:hypothetical protein
MVCGITSPKRFSTGPTKRIVDELALRVERPMPSDGRRDLLLCKNGDYLQR